jgi:hypothetical protein|tara:strand:- start:869 stop:1402 length:534 start_codon:yes stop_codon:yes gene_type:complete
MALHNGKKLGHLLLEADVITKRQLSQAVQKQLKGDKRKLGEILVDLDFITIGDLTEIMVSNGHEVEELPKSKELSESTKFTLSIKTILSAVVGIATIVGFYYMMMSQIDDAKKLPQPGVGTYSIDLGDPSAKESWPPSRGEYKMKDELSRQMILKIQEDIKELKEEIKELRRKVYEN